MISLVKECSVEACGRIVIARGYCGAHYQRSRAGKDLVRPIARGLKGRRDDLVKDISELRFGRLTAKYLLPGRDRRGNAQWHCVCDCGGTKAVPSAKLTEGMVQSCGCLREEVFKEKVCVDCGTAFRHSNNKSIRCSECSRIVDRLQYRGVIASVAEYKALEVSANGKCQSCGSEKQLRIDHDHETGLLRGILCNRCNLTEGYFKDNYKNLLKLYEYCLKHARPST